MDYGVYRDGYLGVSIPEAEWPGFAKRAVDYVEKLKRAYQVSGDEEMAACAVADAMYFFVCAQNGSGGAVYYTSVGTVSMSGKGIFSQIDLSPQGQERELYRCAATYLEIYRGAEREAMSF